MIPCPYAEVASLHFPQLNFKGVPISSISKSKVLSNPKSLKNFGNFSNPTF